METTKIEILLSPEHYAFVSQLAERLCITKADILREALHVWAKNIRRLEEIKAVTAAVTFHP